MKVASALSEDSAPSASLDCLKAQAAPTHPRAQPEPLGSLRWPQELASDRPKAEEFPLSTTRQHADEAYTAAWERLSAATGLKEVDAMTRRLRSWFKPASTLPDDPAPSASLDHLQAQAAPTHPGAPPEPLGSLRWPQEPASGRPKDDEYRCFNP